MIGENWLILLRTPSNLLCLVSEVALHFVFLIVIDLLGSLWDLRVTCIVCTEEVALYHMQSIQFSAGILMWG